VLDAHEIPDDEYDALSLFAFNGRGFPRNPMSDMSQTQDSVETQVQRALAAYKLALVITNYRNWEHRLACFCGLKDALQADDELRAAEAHARRVVNLSEEHRRCVRVLTSRQPEWVREDDRFLALLEAPQERRAGGPHL
jgi:hypothetical protein